MIFLIIFAYHIFLNLKIYFIMKKLEAISRVSIQPSVLDSLNRTELNFINQKNNAISSALLSFAIDEIEGGTSSKLTVNPLQEVVTILTENNSIEDRISELDQVEQ